jgi:hypothetical protein
VQFSRLTYRQVAFPVELQVGAVTARLFQWTSQGGAERTFTMIVPDSFDAETFAQNHSVLRAVDQAQAS